jgi:hypothetical protein
MDASNQATAQKIIDFIGAGRKREKAVAVKTEPPVKPAIQVLIPGNAAIEQQWREALGGDKNVIIISPSAHGADLSAALQSAANKNSALKLALLTRSADLRVIASGAHWRSSGTILINQNYIALKDLSPQFYLMDWLNDVISTTPRMSLDGFLKAMEDSLKRAAQAA